MILKNYINFIFKKQNLIKFNYLNIYYNLCVKNILIICPYYIYKFKLNINIINFYKILLNIFFQRFYLYEFKFKNIFKIKFILLKYLLNIKKYYLRNYLDYFLLFLNYNFNYFIKKKRNIIIFHNKMMLTYNNLHNFYKKFYKYDNIIILKIFIILHNLNKNIYNSFFLKNLLIF